MGDVLFTTAEFAAENPNTVRAFVEATLKGWQYALDNRDATVDMIAEYNPELDRDQLAFEAAETVPLVRYGAGERCPGINDRDTWEAEASLLRSLGIVSDQPDLDAALRGDAVRDYYRRAGVTCGE